MAAVSSAHSSDVVLHGHDRFCCWWGHCSAIPNMDTLAADHPAVVVAFAWGTLVEVDAQRRQRAISIMR